MNCQLSAVATVLSDSDQNNELVNMSPAEISLQGCYVLQVADKEVRSGGPHWRYRGNNQLGGNGGQNE